MLKKSTLLPVSIFFLLFIGLSDYGYGCHRGTPHGQSPVPCPDTDPEPPPDDGGNKGTPVVVTFDDFTFAADGTTHIPDSIQSDGSSYAHEESKTGVLAILDGGFFMNMRAGGDRKLFIDFGDIVDCDTGDPGDEIDNPPFGDCVRDARFDPDSQNNSLLGIVECPFPQDFKVRVGQDRTGS